MKVLVSLCTLLFLLLNSAYAEPVTQLSTSPLAIGDVLQFHSETLNEKRVINVYLPSSYRQSKDAQYPVVYVLDGSREEDFLHISGLVQFNSLSWLNFMPESIVVGIENVDRKRDFTFESSDPRDKKEFPSSGGADDFITFLSSEVMPLINQQYRTSNDKTLIGQSLGGLLATNILFRQPALFDNYLIVSPSLWWDNESLLESKVEVIEDKPIVHIAVGAEGSTMVRLAMSLADKYNHANEQRDASQFKYYEDLNHGDTLHLAAYEGLKAIFSERKQLNKTSKEDTNK